MIQLAHSSTKLLIFFWLIVIAALPHQIIPTTTGDGGQQHNNVENRKETPSAMEIATDIYSLITTSSMSSWHKLKSIVNQVQTQLFPPDLDFRKIYQAKPNSGSDGTGEIVKEAAGKSFGTSKIVVEESAKSAANAVGEAARKTTEKVKEKVSDNKDGSKADL